jgi:hypothetical protein
MTAFDMSESIIAKSDQQNYDEYLGGPKVVTISDVRGGSAEQPVEIHLVEFPGKSYKPSKSMRRVLVFAWGSEASNYVGRKLRLYGDPDVRYGGKPVGGIKIGAMSHIDKPFTLSLTETRGNKKPHSVEVLQDAPTPKPISDDDALDLTRSITEAATIADLDEIARDLKALNLGRHLGNLQEAWGKRKAAIEAEGAK